MLQCSFHAQIIWLKHKIYAYSPHDIRLCDAVARQMVRCTKLTIRKLTTEPTCMKTSWLDAADLLKCIWFYSGLFLTANCRVEYSSKSIMPCAHGCNVILTVNLCHLPNVAFYQWQRLHYCCDSHFSKSCCFPVCFPLKHVQCPTNCVFCIQPTRTSLHMHYFLAT